MKMAANRPTRDEYYLEIAKTVSSRSTCLRRHYGVVIVNNDEIVSTGYNGNPRGLENCVDLGTCSKTDPEHNSAPDSYNICRSVHAEQNALISSRRVDMIGGTMYIACFDCDAQAWVEDASPCPICLRMVQNAGIREVVNSSGRFSVMSHMG